MQRPKRTVPLAGAAALLCAAGCAGPRHDLAREPVAALRASLAGAAALCPGESAPLAVAVSLSDGRELATERGQVDGDELIIASSAHVERGVLRFPPDPRQSETPVRVRVSAPGHPGIWGDLLVPARYDCAFGADFAGAPGRLGRRGETGMPGADGASDVLHFLPAGRDTGEGRFHPSHQAPGGAGGDGGAGRPGARGGDGSAAEAVQVVIERIEKGGRPLLEIHVRGRESGRGELFWVDPRGGSLLVSARGGQGGPGGGGGEGGRGGDGGNGDPPGLSGGGEGGDGGAGGNGGSISVSVSAAARDHLNVVEFDASGGDGGVPGRGGPGGAPGAAGVMYDEALTGSQGRRGRPGTPGRPGPRGRPGAVLIDSPKG